MPAKATKVVRDRQKDETAGIRPGRVNFNPPNLVREEERIPDLSELDVLSTIRKRIVFLVHQHCDLGQSIREAEKIRKTDTDELKALLAEQLAEVPTFTCEGNNVARFTQFRTSIPEDLLRTTMLNMGIAAVKVEAVIKAATKTTQVDTLRVTASKEEA